MRKSKAFRVLGAACALALVTAACGGDDNDDSQAEASATTAGATETTAGASDDEAAASDLPSPDNPSDLEGELTVWHYFNNQGPLDAMNAGIERFQAAYPNVDLSVEVFPFEGFTQKVLTSATTQTGPDVMFYNWAEQQQLIDVGAIVPLDDYFAEYPNAADVPDGAINRVDGATYSIRPYANLISLWYNVDILNELGVAPPETLDDVETIMRAATEAGYKGITSGFNSPTLGLWTGMPYVWAECGDLTMDDEAEVRAALERPVRWVQDGLMSPEVVTLDQSDAVSQFVSGEYAFATVGNWDLTRTTDEASFEVANLPFPGASCDGSVYVSGEGFSVGAFGGNPDLGWEFARIALLQDEAQETFLELAGSIPGSPGLFESPAVQENPLLAAYLEAAQTGMPSVSLPNELKAQQFFGETIIGALSGDISVDEAVSRLVEETPKILADEG